MLPYGMTSSLERVLRSARDVAVEDGASTLESEHLAMALVCESGTAATAVIEQVAPDRESLVEGLKQRTAAVEPVAMAGDIPYSAEAKETLEHLMLEVRQLRHTHICTAHLLLALLSQENTDTARTLQAAGVDLTAARSAVGRLTDDQLDEDN